MFMNTERLKELAEAETATVTMCFHGVTLQIAEPEEGENRLFGLRFLGHMINGDFDPADLSSDKSPEPHREFTMDVPMSAGMMRTVASSIVGAAAEASMLECIGTTEGVSSIDELPEPLRRFLDDVANMGDEGDES